jgi:hypothetical protein
MRRGQVIVAGLWVLGLARCEPSPTPVLLALSEFAPGSSPSTMPVTPCRVNPNLTPADLRRTLYQRTGDLCVVLAAVDDPEGTIASLSVAHVAAIEPVTSAAPRCFGTAPAPILAGLGPRRYNLYFAVLDHEDRSAYCEAACFTVAAIDLDLTSGAPERAVCFPAMQCQTVPRAVFEAAQARCRGPTPTARCRLDLATVPACPMAMP